MKGIGARAALTAAGPLEIGRVDQALGAQYRFLALRGRYQEGVMLVASAVQHIAWVPAHWNLDLPYAMN